MLFGPGVKVYEGQLVGQHAKDNDLTVNPGKEKKLTNLRASGSDENIILTPPCSNFPQRLGALAPGLYSGTLL